MPISDYGLTPEELKRLADIQPEPAPRLIVNGADALNEVPTESYEETHGQNSPAIHSGADAYMPPTPYARPSHPFTIHVRKVVPVRIAQEMSKLFAEAFSLKESRVASSDNAAIDAQISALCLKMCELMGSINGVSLEEKFFLGGSVDIGTLLDRIADLEK